MSADYHLFDCFGVELEYMIVDAKTLDVFPASDRVLHAIAGAYESEVEMGELSWSNELALHVIELKTNGPAGKLTDLAEKFDADVRRINEILDAHGGRLMPTAMHPWMDPHTQTKLWPHEYSPVYEAFNRIFDCRGHGWSNLQSTHLNLPFSGDDEFGRLHAAIRLLMPILPALAASSPVMDGAPTGVIDTRLETYRYNSRKIPSVSGQVIPEAAFSRAEYDRMILQHIYKDLAPHDPEGILQFEWANARGAIARFDRSAIEIRTLDVQECPAADIAILQMIVAALRAIVDERFCPFERQKAWSVGALAELHLQVIEEGELAIIENMDYLRALGLEGTARYTVRDIWRHLVEVTNVRVAVSERSRNAMDVVVEKGPLSRRLLRRLGDAPDRRTIEGAYRELCDCLQAGTLFDA
ncbi:MAG TPA: glutamate-cysteine ligase family protein [Phycisphaerae bacterium]|nr:glutamate-cysteine ligase family protein [Phycisphaerae bacterium]HRW54540.1 glutamate-cysteine ligase family protein [Phycisphaerae bacterium]